MVSEFHCRYLPFLDERAAKELAATETAGWNGGNGKSARERRGRGRIGGDVTADTNAGVAEIAAIKRRRRNGGDGNADNCRPEAGYIQPEIIQIYR